MQRHTQPTGYFWTVTDECFHWYQLTSTITKFKEHPIKIYIGNLSHSMTETELGALVSPHGSIEQVNLIIDHYTRQSKCFGYVKMANRKEGTLAIEALNGAVVNDLSLEVKEALPRDERTGLPC